MVPIPAEIAINSYDLRISKSNGQNRVHPSTLVPGRHLIGQRPPRPDSGRIWNGSTRFCLLTPRRLPDFNHTYPIMAGLFDQQPTRARVIASSREAAGHFCGRHGRACGRTLTLLCSLYAMRLSLTRVTKSYLLALGTTQISSYFTNHWTKFLTHQTGNYPVTCFVSKPSRITVVELSGHFFSEPFVHTHTLPS